ncbi:MAG: ATP-binding protein, partial [Chloroflexi bacterium]|nr:ATP-binding protein [Chloroflexota bacterium]
RAVLRSSTARRCGGGRRAASLAHEINNPLQAIQSCLELAKNNTGDAVKQERYLNMATGELERLAHIVQQMLEFNRPGKGDRTVIDVVELVEDVLALSAKRLQSAQVDVETDLAAQIPRIEGVGNQLRQVFLNLILNAVEAMPHGGRLRISVLSTTEEPPWVTVAFADTGSGIPTEALDKIFEPFYTGKTFGTGLGLAVCHQIVANHEGRITVESAVGRGTTFTVWLPTRVESSRTSSLR